MTDDSHSQSHEPQHPLALSVLEHDIRQYGHHHLLAVGPKANKLVTRANDGSGGQLQCQGNDQVTTASNSGEGHHNDSNGDVASISTATIRQVAMNTEDVSESLEALRQLTDHSQNRTTTHSVTYFDCAVISDLPHQLTPGDLTACIAIVRDQLARVTLLMLDYDEHNNSISDTACCTTIDLTALGFRHMGWYQLATGSTVVFGHNIAHYKNTPDWLNSKSWANPQRWDKERW